LRLWDRLRRLWLTPPPRPATQSAIVPPATHAAAAISTASHAARAQFSASCSDWKAPNTADTTVATTTLATTALGASTTPATLATAAFVTATLVAALAATTDGSFTGLATGDA